jgi:hypothetical protein
MSYSQPFQVECFYSCDKKLAMDVLTGKKNLKKSTNLWDWLGNGVYFWEQNPSRAWEYASENSKGDQFNKTKIETPFVLGAIVGLGICLNLHLTQLDLLFLRGKLYTQDLILPSVSISKFAYKTLI